MPHETRVVSPGSKAHTVRFESGEVHGLPRDWEVLPPGDAGLTRRVKAAGPTWTVKERRGRKMFSRGVWAPAAHIATARRRLEIERADPSYQRKLDAGRRRRDAAQESYVVDFEAAILSFLAFDPIHNALAEDMAKRVAAHATPVGSGTVARTQRIPIEERAKAAVMAWMRHQTTDYDHRIIGREKGKRREVRRQLAKASRVILQRYRRGEAVQQGCLLARAIERPGSSTAVPTGPLARRRVNGKTIAPAPAIPVARRVTQSAAPVARQSVRRPDAAAPPTAARTPPRLPRRPVPGTGGRWPKIARLSQPTESDDA